MQRVLRITFKLGLIAAVGVGIAVVVKKLTAPPTDTASPLEPWPPLSTDTLVTDTPATDTPATEATEPTTSEATEPTTSEDDGSGPGEESDAIGEPTPSSN